MKQPRSNFQIVWSILERGEPIEIGGYTWQLDINGKLCWVAENVKVNEDGSYEGHITDITLNAFVAMCNKEDFNELFVKACASTLKEKP